MSSLSPLPDYEDYENVVDDFDGFRLQAGELTGFLKHQIDRSQAKAIATAVKDLQAANRALWAWGELMLAARNEIAADWKGMVTELFESNEAKGILAEKLEKAESKSKYFTRILDS